MILYILYFTVKEQAIFDWGKLISIEISSQLTHYKMIKKNYGIIPDICYSVLLSIPKIDRKYEGEL